MTIPKTSSHLVLKLKYIFEIFRGEHVKGCALFGPSDLHHAVHLPPTWQLEKVTAACWGGSRCSVSGKGLLNSSTLRDWHDQVGCPDCSLGKAFPETCLGSDLDHTSWVWGLIDYGLLAESVPECASPWDSTS